MEGTVGHKFVGYSAVIVADFFYSGGIITAQLMGKTFPILELNVFRMMAMALVCVVLVVIAQKNVFDIPGVKDMAILFGVSLNYTWMILSITVAPLYVPVGNMESVCITVLILLNIVIGLFKKTASYPLAVAAILSCIGVLFLSQPNFIFPSTQQEVMFKDPCPCLGLQHEAHPERIAECKIALINDSVMYTSMDNTYDNSPTNPPSIRLSTNDVTNSLSTSDVTPKISTNDVMNRPATRDVTTKLSTSDVNSELYTRDVTTIFSASVAPGSRNSQHKSNSKQYQDSPIPGITGETFGYFLAASCGVSFSIAIQVTQKVLLPRYHHAVLSFWYAVTGSVLSALFMFSLETPRFARGEICIGLFVVHCICFSCPSILNNASLNYISTEENSLLQTTCVVTLFVAQHTVLTSLNPSNGNALEYIGAVLVVIACLLDPVHKIIIAKCETKRKYCDKEYLKSHRDSDDITETSLLILRYPTNSGRKYTAA